MEGPWPPAGGRFAGSLVLACRPPRGAPAQSGRRRSLLSRLISPAPVVPWERSAIESVPLWRAASPAGRRLVAWYNLAGDNPFD